MALRSVSAKRRAKVRLAHNSTFEAKPPKPRAVASRSDAKKPLPQKSSKTLSVALSGVGRGRTGGGLKGRSKLRKVNPERLVKRRALYRKKLAAYRKSETYKQVEARSGGRCERTWDFAPSDSKGWVHDPVWTRCPFFAVVHHHKTYARFGGKELPTDIAHLCATCNALAESQHPTRRRDWK